ncbi:MAG: exosortase A [Sphingobium sp.]
MTGSALPLSSRTRPVVVGWRWHIMLLGGAAALILLLFHRDVVDMVSIWWNASTFGHCLFVPFLVGWLVQQRAADLARLEPIAWAPGLAWLGLGALAWALGAAGGVAMIRQGALVVMLQGATLALLGPAVGRALLFPLFYAFFMVPFGEELVPTLQLVTAQISMLLLDLAGVPAHMEGIFITTPTGYFEVAEACSGAKFLIAMTAYGVLVCNVCFTSWRRRVLFLAGALALSVLANGFRAFATILLAHLTTIDAAVGFDHVVYGWVFFAVIMIVVMAAAWPFFDRRPGDPWFDVARIQAVQGKRSRPVVIMSAVVAIVIAVPLWLTVSAATNDPLPARLALPQMHGWTRTDARMAYPWTPRFDGANGLVSGRYRNETGQIVDLSIATFARQDDNHELVGYGQGAADVDSEWVWSSATPAPANARGEQITAPGPVVRHVTSFYSVGGAPLTGSKPGVKLQTLKARMLGRDQRAVAILVSAEQREGQPADPAIARFLSDLGDVQLLADRSIGRADGVR